VKTIRFNRNHSVLRNIEEDGKKKKKYNWDKIVYFIILAGIILFVLKFSLTKILYVEAEGQMMINNLKIRIPWDVTIGEFYKAEGDTILEGDTLFSYNVASEFRPMPELAAFTQSTSNANKSTWEEREIYSLNKNIHVNTSLIQENESLIKWYQKEIAQMENEVILEISSKNKIETYRKDIEKLKLENDTYRRKNAVYHTLIAKLKSKPKSLETTNTTADFNGIGSGNDAHHFYRSPVDGTITQLFKSNHEVALKTENIMNLHKREDLYIKAFFDQGDFQYVREGDKVDIEFPDGSVTQGVIKRFYFATYQLPAEFQKKYEPLTRSIAADISPLDHEDELRWKTFHQMTVNISKFKY